MPNEVGSKTVRACLIYKARGLYVVCLSALDRFEAFPQLDQIFAKSTARDTDKHLALHILAILSTHSSG